MRNIRLEDLDDAYYPSEKLFDETQESKKNLIQNGLFLNRSEACE